MMSCRWDATPEFQKYKACDNSEELILRIFISKAIDLSKYQRVWLSFSSSSANVEPILSSFSPIGAILDRKIPRMTDGMRTRFCAEKCGRQMNHFVVMSFFVCLDLTLTWCRLHDNLKILILSRAKVDKFTKISIDNQCARLFSTCV